MLTVVFGFITLRSVLLGVLLFVVTFSINLIIVSIILVKIPATYFQKNHSREFWKDSSPAIRLLGVVIKNGLGVLLVALGIVLSLPGVPGQGILTILLGIMLLDFPGRRKLETKLLSRPAILKTINKLRHRFGKPALVLD
ncbi:MAG: hypothetical protein H7Z16_17255 [Pyrinomonadaceae bacterium]|nr:hypothetical protein [Pyrinomonadaceae bacterium]